MAVPLADLQYFFFQYVDRYQFLVPLGIVGIWRWSVWLLKELIGRRYKPATKIYHPKGVSIVTPVYNENPQVFTQALHSWAANNPTEIIAVIDYTDKLCIAAFEEFSRHFRGAKLIITKTPGKRPALAEGIKVAKSEIVALVDSDTMWSGDVIAKGLCPFNDKRVAGAGTYQNVESPQTFAQKVFDTHLDIRYTNEFPFLAAIGDALVCLSGRTAFYRRSIILPLLDELVNETFLGRPVISGDDKSLTYMVLSRGWKVAYQNNTTVYTPGMKSLSQYIKQRIRWSRNAMRSDLKAMLAGWTWRHPGLAFFQIDKVLQAFVIIISPIYCGIYLARGMWLPAALIVVWWMVSRTIKMYAHLQRRFQDIAILPAYVVFSIFLGVLKIYSLVTLNTQGWITRWDTARSPQIRLIESVAGYAAAFGIILTIGIGVFGVKYLTYFKPREEQQQLVHASLDENSNFDTNVDYAASSSALPQLVSSKYVVRPGDSLASIARLYGVRLESVLVANVAFITNWNRLNEGTILSIPGKDVQLNPINRFNYQRWYGDPLTISYDPAGNTIYIGGRGQIVNLRTIADHVGSQYLTQVAPKEWYLTASLYLRSGVRLDLDQNEVTWLKMASNKQSYVSLIGYNSDIQINGVKITSWNTDTNTYDTDIADGRSFILVKDGSRMDIYSSELAYLGFARTATMTVSPYGVSWRMSNGKLGTTLLTGEIISSQFHDNYFGAYMFGATGMTWRNNKFFANTRYGLDPHDDSNGFLVENNEAFSNGTHGIIFSKRCLYNIVRNNYSHDNGLHGIMLHEKSDFNVITDNVLENNHNGVTLWHSSNNFIANNIIANNSQGIRANVDSNDNTIANNTITNSSDYGIYLYDGASGNRVVNNQISQGNTAVYLKTPNNIVTANTIAYNSIGIYFLEGAFDNKVFGNTIEYNMQYGMYSKVRAGLRNQAMNNDLFRNRKNIVAAVYN